GEENGVVPAKAGATLPWRAGLSHVAKELKKKGIIPAGALELEAQGGVGVGMGSGDVEGKSPEDGKVGRAVVLAIAGQILVEDDVERPVQAVFDGPMGANDAQNLCATVVLAHQEVALDGFILAALAADLRDGFEAREVVRLLHVLDRHDKRTARF